MDYLGNKSSLLPVLREVVAARVGTGSQVADVFAGTAVVSSALRGDGYRVHANDILPLSAAWCRARLLGDNPRFEGLANVFGPGKPTYADVVDHLNRLRGEEGWITVSYSPSEMSGSVERRYLTVDNAMKLDAVRHLLRAWRPLLTEGEHSLLITSTVRAVSKVSNIAGTYGSFLKHWKTSALQPLCIEVSAPAAGLVEGHRVTSVDAEQVVAETEAQLVYADPPYTKRQYAAYYHLLNSVVTDDEPELTGFTGLPDWRQWASDWCYRARAPEALERLVAKSSAPHLVLSYSSDGHIPHDVVVDTLSTYGQVDVIEISRRVYKSSSRVYKDDLVTERIYVMSR